MTSAKFPGTVRLEPDSAMDAHVPGISSTWGCSSDSLLLQQMHH